VLATAAPRKEIGRAIASLPGFWVLRAVNAAHVLAAFWAEFVRRRSFRVYEKGH
jgi:poly-beta-1,6-N-acetyl-D-glucosamine synthase